jgi:hypothetical protein
MHTFVSRSLRGFCVGLLLFLECNLFLGFLFLYLLRSLQKQVLVPSIIVNLTQIKNLEWLDFSPLPGHDVLV